MSNIAYLMPSSGFRGMSDAEIEAHIQSAGQLMEDAYSRYKVGQRAVDLTIANRFRLLMEQAIAFRSPAQVERMEAERGLV